jgi:hypothetical protein
MSVASAAPVNKLRKTMPRAHLVRASCSQGRTISDAKWVCRAVRDGTFVDVAMGTLVDDPTVRPTKHIFVGSKARWFTISDDLPQYEEHAATAERTDR